MKFKDDVIASRFEDMNSLSQLIATEADEFCKEKYGIEITLTATVSTPEEDKELSRVSDTHRTRRAFDIRTNDLPESLVAELIDFLTKKFGKFGAVANTVPNIVVYKPHGTGPHLHVQLNRKYALPILKYIGAPNGKES